MADIDLENLQQTWVHAHEEDEAGLRVFRPASWSLPPSRGRQKIDLSAGGTAQVVSPGPDDRPQAAEAGWEVVHGDRLTLGKAAYTIVEASADRLVLKA